MCVFKGATAHAKASFHLVVMDLQERISEPCGLLAKNGQMRSIVLMTTSSHQTILPLHGSYAQRQHATMIVANC